MPEQLFYRLSADGAVPVSEAQFLQGGANLVYLSDEKLKEHRARLGIPEAVLGELSAGSGNFRNSLDVYEDVSAGYINIINVDDLSGEMDTVMFILRRDLLCLVSIQDGDGSELATFRSIMAQETANVSVPRVFCRFLERLLRGGNRMLETIEERLLGLEDEVVHGRADEGLNRVIYGYRRQLSMIRNYYEQLVDISTELEENENRLFDGGAAVHFRVLSAKAGRLVQGVRELSENLMHLREMLDAALNYKMNSIMKVFTMIAAVFLPLTLLVGWYGMNFRHMPELDWRWGYPMVIALSTVIVVLILIMFRKKKLL